MSLALNKYITYYTINPVSGIKLLKCYFVCIYKTY